MTSARKRIWGDTQFLAHMAGLRPVGNSSSAYWSHLSGNQGMMKQGGDFLKKTGKGGAGPIVKEGKDNSFLEKSQDVEIIDKKAPSVLGAPDAATSNRVSKMMGNSAFTKEEAEELQRREEDLDAKNEAFKEQDQKAADAKEELETPGIVQAGTRLLGLPQAKLKMENKQAHLAGQEVLEAHRLTKPGRKKLARVKRQMRRGPRFEDKPKKKKKK